jgi:hemolysin III
MVGGDGAAAVAPRPRHGRLLLSGGILYTLGAVVYATKRPDPWPRVFGFHEVFHAFTIAGAGCHLAVISFVVVPRMAL